MEPKNCPYCGRGDIVIKQINDYVPPFREGFVVYCYICRMHSPIQDTQEDAIRVWNSISCAETIDMEK